ncbi:MAG: DUF924 family protein [Polyangiales bacterium]
MLSPADVLRAWFDTDDVTAITTPLFNRWFTSDPAFDESLRARFGAHIDEGARGAFAAWEETPAGVLALVVLLDQFSRNVHRGSARTYAADPAALDLAGRMLARGDDRRVAWLARLFIYLPFEHAESLPAQERAVALFTALAAEAPEGLTALGANLLDYAQKHHAVIARFGRFPHRNADLGRVSTADEEAFLQNGRGF